MTHIPLAHELCLRARPPDKRGPATRASCSPRSAMRPPAAHRPPSRQSSGLRNNGSTPSAVRHRTISAIAPTAPRSPPFARSRHPTRSSTRRTRRGSAPCWQGTARRVKADRLIPTHAHPKLLPAPSRCSVRGHDPSRSRPPHAARAHRPTVQDVARMVIVEDNGPIGGRLAALLRAQSRDWL